MEIMDGNTEVIEVSFSVFERSWVSELSLVVGHWPLGSAHHSQLVVPVWVNAAEKSVLGGKGRPGH